ncbi:MAG: M20/M25/M40 family metallo-hydrolase [Acidobacteria bacterium]|nr:M20/M25/M40 family metallo-hydrolase [Acidobacteriota bacterium]
MPLTAVLLLLTAMISSAIQGPLTADERAMVAHVDTHNDEAVRLLERVVNINSGTQNFEGVREVGDIFRAEFDALGFQTTWVDGAPFKRAGHLVAEKPGTGPKFLLIGHLDTVFERDSPFQKAEWIDDRYLRGPGIIDMKGGNVIILQALKALDGIGALKDMDVTVVFTGDEEDPGEPRSLARQALVDAAKGRDIAIGFEDGPADPKYAVTARRGTTSWEVRVTGKVAHSSQIFRDDVGFGAIYEAARILNAFRERMAGEALLTFNPGTFLGGTTVEFDEVQARGTAFGKTNVIAEHAVIAGDLRTISPEQLARAKKAMEEIVKGSLPHTEAAITFGQGYPPLPPSHANAKLLEIYTRASEDLGFGPVTAVSPERAGAADVAFVHGIVPSIIDGLGLMGADDHSLNERADMHTLPSQTKRAAVFLYRLANP